ncbi:MAG: response regulator, partial [Bacteroidota bacterium]
MKTTNYRCLIVDDEPLARECLENYVREIDFLEVAGTASNPLELTAKLNQQPVDLLFLDIQMPKMNGLDFIRQSQKLPPIVLTTAFPGYALEGFSLDVVDYLLKPITFNRFFQSVQ